MTSPALPPLSRRGGASGAQRGQGEGGERDGDDDDNEDDDDDDVVTVVALEPFAVLEALVATAGRGSENWSGRAWGGVGLSVLN